MALLVAVLLFGFTPIQRVLLSSVHGSFAPSSYSSLALSSPSNASGGFIVGESVPIRLTNRTGRIRTYHWSATEKGALISLGVETLNDGQTMTILVPSRGAVTGRMQIALTGTNIFLTVPMLKS